MKPKHGRKAVQAFQFTLFNQVKKKLETRLSRPNLSQRKQRRDNENGKEEQTHFAFVLP
jgi:hypothetical protein